MEIIRRRRWTRKKMKMKVIMRMKLNIVMTIRMRIVHMCTGLCTCNEDNDVYDVEYVDDVILI